MPATRSNRQAGWRAGHPLCPKDTLNYARNPANLGHARGDTWRSGIAEVEGLRQLLRPGGLLVTVTKNTRKAGHSPTCRYNRCGCRTGWVRLPAACHSPDTAVRDGRLVARPSFWQLTQTSKPEPRGASASGRPRRRACLPQAFPRGRLCERTPSAAAAIVWPTAQQPAATQRTGRYLPGSTAHPPRCSPPSPARPSAPTASRRPGRGPIGAGHRDPGRGQTPGLTAIVIELEARWAELASANIANARRTAPPGRPPHHRGRPPLPNLVIPT